MAIAFRLIQQRKLYYILLTYIFYLRYFVIGRCCLCIICTILKQICNKLSQLHVQKLFLSNNCTLSCSNGCNFKMLHCEKETLVLLIWILVLQKMSYFAHIIRSKRILCVTVGLFNLETSLQQLYGAVMCCTYILI